MCIRDRHYIYFDYHRVDVYKRQVFSVWQKILRGIIFVYESESSDPECLNNSVPTVQFLQVLASFGSDNLKHIYMIHI